MHTTHHLFLDTETISSKVTLFSSKESWNPSSLDSGNALLCNTGMGAKTVQSAMRDIRQGMLTFGVDSAMTESASADFDMFARQGIRK
jgi:hypothetical protein